MDNKKYIDFLNTVKKLYDERIKQIFKVDDKEYRKLLKERSTSLDISNYKIIKGHTLEEYFNAYNKYLGHNVFVYQEDELWLMNPKKEYWEIKNDSNLVYFEVPTKTLMFMYPWGCALTAFLLVGGITAGVLCGTLLNKGSGSSDPIIPPEPYEGLKLTAEQAGSKVGYKILKSTGASGALPDINIQYSTDIEGENWTDWDGEDLTLENVNDFIYVRNTAETLSTYDDNSGTSTFFNFNLTGKIASSGNVNSMINFSELSYYCYTCMFFNNGSTLTSAPELPATTLAEGCYSKMFAHCTSITSAPELPATALMPYCYSNMFANCASLITFPELSATTLAESCYSRMFSECTSLSSAPSLSDATLVDGCYYSMFDGCTSLQVGETTNSSIANKIFTCPSTTPTGSVICMFSNTGGSFTGGTPPGTPNPNSIYYWYE